MRAALRTTETQRDAAYSLVRAALDSKVTGQLFPSDTLSIAQRDVLRAIHRTQP
jgi:hypothetical protein